ncbi:Vegetative incompatibility protein HET-E-1 [Fusarium austroafricanum]|uniref:Vegetative incompatibility protein HET-E-1 n=1 Tax=Fusarium austroafricanum TaxID=2364996 RepID=A0A8H4NQ31_9HYPO|nr:Vegetative incompatibility protein HET-E-1 [Fusarium austroafricanum]
MAELAALGAAASVLQVIDFGTRFIITLWQVRQSKHDFFNSLGNLHISSKNLRDAQQELQAICQPGSSTDTAICALAKKSEAIATEMLDSLERIEQSDHGRKRDALMKAWLILWKEERLKSLESQLNQVKADLTFYLSVNLRATARETLENQTQMLLEMRAMRADIKSLGGISGANDVQAGFGSLALEYLIGGLHERQKIKSEFTAAMIARIHNPEAQSPPDSSSIQLSAHRRKQLEQIFISRIRYDTIQERELTIKDAHKGTFNWIFKGEGTADSSTGFKEWLVSDDSLYWITGKPGSGKSTLMKYLLQPIDQSTQQNRCEEYLQQWAGEKNLTIASFHFWAIGSDIQASQEGLFRTLLVQLLRAHPDVIPLVAPSRWESLCLFNEDPRHLSPDELGDMFRQAVRHISFRAKLALFIDGLDEFDGDCNTLISLVQEFTLSPIKICISSRPWTEFENAFGDYPRLKMEDLTYNDIIKYVVSKFEADSQFKRFQRMQPQLASTLSHSIADKASGVFLWVTIVVASLLAGIVAGDRVEDLENRLNLLPAEMDDLYERIIESIDPLYREHAAQLFKLVYACKVPPSLRVLWYADEVKFLDRVIDEDPVTVPLEEVLGRLENMRRRLVSRCRGLLEVHETTPTPPMSYPEGASIPDDATKSNGGSVVYLHRTFSEFLNGPDTQEKLNSYLTEPFDPNLRIAAGYASLTKLWMRSRTPVRQTTYIFQYQLMDGLHYAGKALSASRNEVVQLMDHLRDQCAALCHFDYRANRFREPQGTWQRKLTEIETSRYSYDPNQEFLCLATMMGVREYISAKADPGGFAVTAQRTPSKQGLKLSWISWRLQGNPEVLVTSLLSLVPLTDSGSAPMMKLLLDRGAKPNKAISQIGFRKTTAWEEVLANAISTAELQKGGGVEEDCNVTECVRLMLLRGARVSDGTVERAIRISRECMTPRHLVWTPGGISQARQAIIVRRASLDNVNGLLKLLKTNPEARFIQGLRVGMQ